MTDHNSMRRVGVRLGRGINLEYQRQTETAPAPAYKDAWTAGSEVDALLAQLRGDRAALVDVLQRMSIHELAALGQHLYTLSGVLAEVATAKARS